MMTNKYSLLDSEGTEHWMLVNIVVCEVCKRGCVMHGSERQADKDARATFAHLDFSRMGRAVLKNKEMVCYSCLDAIHLPERQEKVSYRGDDTD